MWLMTTTGFVSVVEKKEDQGLDTLTVRARDARSLNEFAQAAGRASKQYQMDMATDYPFRDTFTRAEVQAALVHFIQTLDYSNFKNAAKARRGEVYAHALNNVWWDMQKLTTRKVKKAMDSAWVSYLPNKSRWGKGGAWSDDSLAYTSASYDTPAVPEEGDNTGDDVTEVNGKPKRIDEMTDAEWREYLCEMYGEDNIEGLFLD